MKILVPILLLCLSLSESWSQELRIREGKSIRVFRDIKANHALIMFESSIEDLLIEFSPKDSIVHSTVGKRNYYIIETDLFDGPPYYVPNDRTFYIKSYSSQETRLDIYDMQPKNVYCYTVVEPKKYPFVISAEYLFTKASICGLRVSAGRQFGGYFSYSWGRYKASGTNIDNFDSDADVSRAQFKGYIRNSLTAGVRIGVNQKYVPAYIYVGGGYGEYGRQWENYFLLDDSIYFYSDYIKGVELELGASVNLFECIYASVGADCLINGGNVSIDYQIGVGLALKPEWFKKHNK